MESELKQMKKIFDEERRVNAKNRSRQYQIERELGQLQMKVYRWEKEEEQRMMRKRERMKEEKDEGRES